MALEFKIDLTGNFSGALEKGNKNLGETTKKAHEAEKAFEAFEYELGKTQAGALALNFNAFKEGGHFLTFDLAEGAAVAYEAIEKVVDAVIDLGKEILKAAGNAEDLNLAVKLDVGVEGAEAVEKLTNSFKRTSRFDDDAIKKSLLPLLEQNGALAGTQLLDDVATAATDLAARRNQGVEGVQAALQAFQRISLKGEVDPRVLRELAISEVDFFKDLGGLLGVSAKEAEALSKAGKVKTQTLLSVALNQIAQREGGALGKATLEASATLGASIERLRNLPENVFKRAEGGAGTKEIQKGIDALVTTLDGPVGQKAIASFDKLLGAIGKFANTHAEAVFAGLSSALDTLSSIIDGNNESWNHFTQTMGVVIGAVELGLKPFTLLEGVFLSVAGAVIRAGTVIDGFILDAFGKIADFIKPFYDAAIDLGNSIWQGIVDGIKHGVSAVGDAISGIGHSAVDAAKNALGIHSPSKVFYELGAYTTTGFAQGITGAAPSIDLSVGNIANRAISETATASAPGAVSAIGGGFSVSIGDINVYPSGGGTSTAEERHETAQAVRVEISKVIDEMRATLGVA